MNPHWLKVINRLQTYPQDTHRLLPPCSRERLQAVETVLGKLTEALQDMLMHFNGAELFTRDGPLATLFGISTIPPMPSLEWAPDWYIDKFTPEWRVLGPGRNREWVVGMTNYGGLILLNDEGTISEWDTSEFTWLLQGMPFGQWIESILDEGESLE